MFEGAGAAYLRACAVTSQKLGLGCLDAQVYSWIFCFPTPYWVYTRAPLRVIACASGPRNSLSELFAAQYGNWAFHGANIVSCHQSPYDGVTRVSKQT